MKVFLQSLSAGVHPIEEMNLSLSTATCLGKFDMKRTNNFATLGPTAGGRDYAFFLISEVIDGLKGAPRTNQMAGRHWT